MTEQSLIGTKEERRHRIGGSDFGSVLDINPYKSRFELVLNKAGVLYDFFTGNEYTKRGEELEDTIIKMFEDATNLKVTDQQKEFATFHAPAGSYAEKYAQKHNIPFVAE